MEEIFSLHTHYETLLSNLSAKRASSEMCDVVFTVEDQKYPAHRCIMAASSDYFNAMFSGNFNEKDSKTISLEGITVKAFEAILDFVYSARLALTTETVQEIYAAADLLHYPLVKESCVTFMLSDMRAESCVSYMLFSLKYSEKELEDSGRKCFEGCFHKAWKDDQFRYIPLDLLMKILDSDNLVSTEEDVLMAICDWLQYQDMEEDKIADLLGTVRYGLFSDDFEDLSVKQRETVGFENTCNFLQKVVKYFVNPKKQALHPAKCVTPRGPLCLVSVGGSSSSRRTENTLVAGQLKNRLGEITIQRPLPRPVTQAAVVTKNNFMYVIGGTFDPSDSTSKVAESSLQRYDTGRNHWIQLCPMNVARYTHTAVCLGDHIYVMCGIGNDGKSLCSVEKYSILEDKWDTITEFPRAVYGAAAAIHGGKIYVSGGYCSSQSPYVQTGVYTQCPKSLQWLLVGNLSCGRYDHAMCSYSGAQHGQLVVIGGKDSSNYRKSEMEVFDILSSLDANVSVVTSQLVKGTSMPFKCSEMGNACVYHDSKIYVVGGYSDTVKDTVLKYDLVKKEWQVCNLKLPNGCRDCAVCLLVFPFSAFPF